MNKKEFDQGLNEHHGAIAKLLESEEMRQMNSAYAHNCINVGQSMLIVESLISKVQQLNVPMHYVASWCSKSSYQRPLISELIGGKSQKKAFNKALAAGLNVWLLGITWKAGGPCESVWTEPELVSHQIFPSWEEHKETPISHRHDYLKAALTLLDKMPLEIAKAGVKAIIDQFEETLKNVSLSRPGLLSLEDHNALANAMVLVGAEVEWDQSVEQLKLDRSALDLAFEKANKIISIKQKKNISICDPATLKKTLTEGQIERIRSLNHLQKECLLDSKALELVIEGSGWINDEPQVLAIALKGRSFIHQALITGNQTSINWIEKIKANVWIASAQNNCENAIEWFARESVDSTGSTSWSQEREDVVISQVPQWARMIAYGAMISGEEDSLAFVLKKSDEALERLKKERRFYEAENGVIKTYLAAMRSNLEKIIISDLVEKTSTLSSIAVAEAATKKKARVRL